MSYKKPSVPSDPTKRLAFLDYVIKQVKLVWMLFRDKRVSIGAKAILPFSLLYLVSPVDFLPDVFLGLGQLDDLGIILLGMALFLKMCPPDLVAHYTHLLEYGDAYDDSQTVDTTYRVVDED